MDKDKPKNRMQKKQNYFGEKYGNRKNIRERLNALKTWKKNYKGSEKAMRLKYNWNRSEQHLKKYRIGKIDAMIAHVDSGKKKFTSIFERVDLETNRCLEEARIPE